VDVRTILDVRPCKQIFSTLEFAYSTSRSIFPRRHLTFAWYRRLCESNFYIEAVALIIPASLGTHFVRIPIPCGSGQVAP